MSSTSTIHMDLSQQDKEQLMAIARHSISYGLSHDTAPAIDISQYSADLQSHGASFVTLNINHQLRGCIGTLKAYQPLARDVAEHAFAAAFKDPRFSPLTDIENNQLEIHISVLMPAETMHCQSEADLLQQLQPGIDGLILKAGHHQATFLPSVWESLADSKQFVQHLKLKAGLDKNYWSDDIQLQRYRTLSIP